MRVVSFRTTRSEYARLEFNSAATLIQINQIARDRVLGQAIHPVIEIVPKVDPSLIQEIHYIGHNLNQLVKNAHIFGIVSPDVEALCLRIEHLINRAIAEDID
ncbi:hypothetical protein JIN85_15270 [Luteolibacter pohnpeiensis]|uniref:Bacterial mobilisation domain-containing protein n=1 Tax=Luteolibacter pohnpeiensis TaxID=454153 RepID=A0A934VXF4_9BACT|nr:hypothetical protein [Luteolibacter pohnpeiensis]